MAFPPYEIYDDGAAVANQACKKILTAAEQAIAERGAFRLVMAGGSTPEATYRALASSNADWSNWHIYFGDERCLPVDDSERNSVMVARSLTDHVAIPVTQIHSMAAELGAAVAAASYAEIISTALPFDTVLLGMGEDGHTASLFPGHEHDVEETVHAVHNAPKPPSDRVSISAKTLSNTRQLLMLITGAGKQEALQQWRSGVALPITTIKAADMLVMLDKAAWPE